MILRRLRAHVEAENWFAVAIDFVIVVVGVFIGIQVANWNEAQQDRARLSQAVEALRGELAWNYFVAQERLSLKACRVQQMNRVVAALQDTETDWSGLIWRDTDTDAGYGFVFQRVLASPHRPSRGRLWRSELSQGTFQTMDRGRRDALDFIFEQSRDSEELQDRILEAQAGVQVLSTDLVLAPSDRLRYLELISLIDQHSALLELFAAQMSESIRQLDLQFTEAEKALIEPVADKFFDDELRRTRYGDCVLPIQPLYDEATPRRGQAPVTP